MNHRLISETEIQQRQHDIRRSARYARNSFTISGLRQLFGNTFISFGLKIHGHCEQRMENRNTTPAVATAQRV